VIAKGGTSSGTILASRAHSRRAGVAGETVHMRDAISSLAGTDHVTCGIQWPLRGDVRAQHSPPASRALPLSPNVVVDRDFKIWRLVAMRPNSRKRRGR
jgi:hypothetical protein